MSKVFISYRRDDSGYVAGMLAQKLQDRFGRKAVFIDIDNIPLGSDFRDQIAQAVGQCDVLLALIGDSWLTATSEDGRRRIDAPTDFVRLELEAALTRQIPVVPVLVDSARMPTETELPVSLQALVYRNATEIRAGRDLQHHLNVLTSGIESLIATQQPPSRERPAVKNDDAVDSLRPQLATPALKPVGVADVSFPPDPDTGRPTYHKALLLNAVCGCGLFYADPRSPRRWLYPSVIVAGAIIMLAGMPNFRQGAGLVLVGPSMALVVVGYVASYVDVIRTCVLRRRVRASAGDSSVL